MGSYSGFADIAGRYRAVMPAGARVMVVSAPAFQRVTRELMLRPGTKRDEDIVLEIDASADVSATIVDEWLSVRVCRCGDPYGVDPLDENGRDRPYAPPLK
jgi:hypothetical protein